MIRWGILGAGNIARRFADSLRQEPDGVLSAISCRSEEKAALFMERYAPERAYVGHERLLEDPEVDAVYLALPHGLHREWAVKALQAGKAVLCEKPAVLNADEMREIAAEARSQRLLFMEAMKPRFVPLYAELKRLLAEGMIGDLTGVETSLCNQMPFDQYKLGSTYHTQPGQGGALLDGGTYCASWLDDLLPGRPVLQALKANQKDGVDYYINAELRFEGLSGKLECAFDRAKARRAILRGTAGHIVVEELHRPQAAAVCVEGQEPQMITMPYIVDDFYGEIHHFTQCLLEHRNESSIMPLSASIRCAEILDTVRAGLCKTPYSDGTLPGRSV